MAAATPVRELPCMVSVRRTRAVKRTRTASANVICDGRVSVISSLEPDVEENSPGAHVVRFREQFLETISG
jgi:hypothetical protein